MSLSVGFFSEALVLARVLDEGGIAISIHERMRAGGGKRVSENAHGVPPGPTPDVPGVDVPGSTSRGRDSPGHWPARGRPGVGTHLGSPWPRCDIHYESPGVPSPTLPPTRASVMLT